MSVFHSDKCSKEILQKHKENVINFLSEYFDISSFKIKAFNCYGGDVRIYTGEYQEFPNRKSSFRRTEARKNEEGEVIGYYGTRGIHLTRFADYIAIPIDEFKEMKQQYYEMKNGNKYTFWEEHLFRKLTPKSAQGSPTK